MNSSVVILTDTTQLAAANALLSECGWGADNFRAELSADGAAPVTHLGLHAMAQPDFVTRLTAALDAEPELAASLRVSLRSENDRWGHFNSVVATANLIRVEPDLPD
ncbi:MAG: hypothetical protein OQK00_05925 [Rhodobacteraceae bacterium]|nr:hypothetical protein [Paracoccaceae bacterium]MCW9043958.1 hypothetical protein [Pseudopelagicola sp.]